MKVTAILLATIAAASATQAEHNVADAISKREPQPQGPGGPGGPGFGGPGFGPGGPRGKFGRGRAHWWWAREAEADDEAAPLIEKRQGPGGPGGPGGPFGPGRGEFGPSYMA